MFQQIFRKNFGHLQRPGPIIDASRLNLLFALAGMINQETTSGRLPADDDNRNDRFRACIGCLIDPLLRRAD
jgi:hypothetical protein